MKKRVLIISIMSFLIISILTVTTVLLIMNSTKNNSKNNPINTNEKNDDEIINDNDKKEEIVDDNKEDNKKEDNNDNVDDLNNDEKKYFEKEYKYKTSLLKTPNDETNPTNYSSKENLYFTFYNLEHKDSFKMEEKGTTTAQVLFIKQTQKIYKSNIKINDEAMLTTVSSGTVNIAYQTYFKEYGKTIYQRNTNSINDLKPAFSDETPSKKDVNEYLDEFGVLPYQASRYIICDETILNISNLKYENNLYQITIDLNPDDSKAPHWFKNEIMKLGHTETPKFLSINVTYKFDSNWNIIEVETKEKYKVKTEYSLGIEVECETNYKDTFEYENVSFENEYYNYFKKYDN